MTRPSDRQTEILRLVADGYTNTQIAAHLYCSLRTVKNDLQDLQVRFGLRNRAHAAAHAIRSGWI
jgi:DNA-binding CsgD family transcriptional regulator